MFRSLLCPWRSQPSRLRLAPGCSRKTAPRPVALLLLVLAAVLLLACAGAGVAAPASFKTEQLRHARVRKAYQEKEALLRDLFRERNLVYPPKRIFIRIFKSELDLEVWTLCERDSTFHLVNNYPVCGLSGSLGPKRRQGDLQVPEGFYHIDRFNPVSNFHLSLGINYPNESDVILGESANLGGDIFIHGGCATIGCIPMTDEWIKEIYVLAVEARNNGQPRVPVHIFPMRPATTEGPAPPAAPPLEGWRLRLAKLLVVLIEAVNSVSPVPVFTDLLDELKEATSPVKPMPPPPPPPFPRELKECYDFFEENRKLPRITVDSSGLYKCEN